MREEVRAVALSLRTGRAAPALRAVRESLLGATRCCTAPRCWALVPQDSRGRATPTTAAASTHDVGEFEMQSSDFSVPYPYKFPIAPSYSGLTGAASQNTNPNGQSFVKYPSGQGIPTAQRCLINTFYVNRDAKGAGSKFMGFVSFLKKDS